MAALLTIVGFVTFVGSLLFLSMLLILSNYFHILATTDYTQIPEFQSIAGTPAEQWTPYAQQTAAEAGGYLIYAWIWAFLTLITSFVCTAVGIQNLRTKKKK